VLYRSVIQTRSIDERWDVRHAASGEHPSALDLLMLVIFQHHRDHQACDKGVDRQEADIAGASYHHCAAKRTSLGDV
jgi:hypothetical protein